MTPLALTDAEAAYGETRVLGPLSLALAPGERIALVGKSGAGKSTLLALMYEQWQQREVALMPQALGLVDTLSVFHNVYMGRLDRHPWWRNLITLMRPRRSDIADIEALLEGLDIADKCWIPCGELSGGQRQRVAAARVLYQRGQVLLADEPVSALDGPQAASVMQALADGYPTAVLAMHDLDLALRYCTRVIGIQAGEIAIDQPSQRLSVHDLQPLY
ncbi:phosphonate transport system ATP-binding protein [Franzmannia pantelleriensis]|uniref:Phosphonate transport system ATP-binding protein n=1 Tax=Franzmannia pantelleriensis TaxID=48727 RepID=A0A1G9II72_9GAMM|nr:ATP-binding cassette domain-containing protein [Halomonas pantelleriensis]SDL24887.1 phosphonate transport system ATP-binding protein [Halomonas pantelleriensis]